MLNSKSKIGEVAEWLKAHAWKACIQATVSWVRIPLPPPYPRPEGFSSQLVIIVAQIIDSDLTLQSGNNIRS